MLKFNNDNIFTGHIKQILASTNLPTYKFYTKEHYLYKKTNGIERPDIYETVDITNKDYREHSYNFQYLKNGQIESYINDGTKTFWRQTTSYVPGSKVLNHTKKLKIKNNIYDSDTHEYLGEYLRYLRDIHELDLMPLYNCFSNRLCNNLVVSYSSKINKVNFVLNSEDTKYKIYRLPIKLYKNYTIAIDSDSPVEICCGLYNKYYYSPLEYDRLSADTYKRFAQIHFNQPILYTALTDLFNKIDRVSLLSIARNEQDLTMFIKIPSSNKSSITILEGDYRTYNDKFAPNATKKFQNYTVTNFEGLDENTLISAEDFSERPPFKPITNLELLSLNTNESYPFASKLIEYLSENVITGIDEVADNISRTQKIISDLSDHKITNMAGVWDQRLQAALYEQIIKLNSKYNLNNDALGYVDKKTETLVSAFDSELGKQVSLANVDLYDELYLATKE